MPWNGNIWIPPVFPLCDWRRFVTVESLSSSSSGLPRPAPAAVSRNGGEARRFKSACAGRKPRDRRETRYLPQHRWVQAGGDELHRSPASRLALKEINRAVIVERQRAAQPVIRSSAEVARYSGASRTSVTTADAIQQAASVSARAQMVPRTASDNCPSSSKPKC